MTTLDAGAVDVPPGRARSAFWGLAAAAMAVAGFVASSLVLKALSNTLLGSLKLAEDSFGQSAEYLLITAVSMFAVRKAMDLMRIRYDGRVVVLLFLAISIVVMGFALCSAVMRVDLVTSLLRMAAMCLFSYFLFWRRNELVTARGADLADHHTDV